MHLKLPLFGRLCSSRSRRQPSPEMTLKAFQMPSSGSPPCREIPLEMEPLFDDKDSSWRNSALEERLKVKPNIVKKTKHSFFTNKQCDLSHMGLVMAVASSLMFSLCSLLVKVLSDIPSSELAVFRFAGILLPTLPLVIARGDPLFPKGKRFILILRGIFGTTALLLQFYAFQHLALGDASVIVFSAPVFVAIFARIFLKETCGIFQALLIVLTLAGVTLITRPPWLFGHLTDTYTSSEWKGAIAAFCGTIVAANVYVMLRVLKTLHYSVILFDFAIFALLVTPFVTLFSSQPCLPHCGSQRLMIIAIGIFSFCGQILKTKALQLEEAGPVAIARTADVIFAFIWQLIFFGEIPDALTVLGTLMVTSSVLFLGIRRWIISKPKNSATRRRLACLAW